MDRLERLKFMAAILYRLHGVEEAVTVALHLEDEVDRRIREENLCGQIASKESPSVPKNSPVYDVRSA